MRLLRPERFEPPEFRQPIHCYCNNFGILKDSKGRGGSGKKRPYLFILVIALAITCDFYAQSNRVFVP